jgi:predicted lipoprotein
LFDKATKLVCGVNGVDKLAAARNAYLNVLGTWMRIEHIRFGPVEILMRNFRIHFWPDKGGRGRRQIRAYLSSKNLTDFSKEKFRFTSVAVQALTAAEHILFSPAVSHIQKVKDNKQRGLFLGAIAGNVEGMSLGLAEEWAEFTKLITLSVGPDAYFQSHKEVTSEFLKGAYTSLQVMSDLKLNRVVGDGIVNARL